MKHRWAARISVLALCALVVTKVGGQGANTPPSTSQRISGSLGQNSPNPFNPETTIPFSIGVEGNPPVCVNPNQQHRVSLRIYDLLTKPVAIPVIQGGDYAGQPADNLVLGCGEYKAHWDGTRIGTSQKVPSGIYLYLLTVDGKSTMKRMTVTK
jgi:hypothetical protein